MCVVYGLGGMEAMGTKITFKMTDSTDLSRDVLTVSLLSLKIFVFSKSHSAGKKL